MSSLTYLRRRLPLHVVAIASASLLILATVMAGSAFGHGTATDPPSRQFDCWQRWGGDFQNPAMATQDPMCWQAWQADTQAMWNWNGLYREGVGGNHQGAIPDGQLCSGGRTDNGRYAAMDVPGNWNATAVNNNFTVRVHDQADHGADYYRVYVTRQGFNPLTDQLRWSDLELVAETGRIAPGVGDPASPGVSVAINASAPGRTGRHIVYTIWQASHFDQSFYMCSDVIFPGGSTPTQPPPTTAPPTTAPPTTTPPTTQPPTTAPPTTQPPGVGGCSAQYTVVNSWQGGFQGEVTVTAGATAISGWEVVLALPAGQTIVQSWSAALTGSSGTVSASNVSWNGSLTAGQSTTFGFLGTSDGAVSAPGITCIAS